MSQKDPNKINSLHDIYPDPHALSIHVQKIFDLPVFQKAEVENQLDTELSSLTQHINSIQEDISSVILKSSKQLEHDEQQAIKADKAKLDANNVKITQEREKMVYLENFEIKTVRTRTKKKKFVRQTRARQESNDLMSLDFFDTNIGASKDSPHTSQVKQFLFVQQ